MKVTLCLCVRDVLCFSSRHETSTLPSASLNPPPSQQKKSATGDWWSISYHAAAAMTGKRSHGSCCQNLNFARTTCVCQTIERWKINFLPARPTKRLSELWQFWCRSTQTHTHTHTHTLALTYSHTDRVLNKRSVLRLLINLKCGLFCSGGKYGQKPIALPPFSHSRLKPVLKMF